MELVFVGIAFIIFGILLLVNTDKKSKSNAHSNLKPVHKDSGLGRFVERIEKLKINHRNYIEPEQLSGKQKQLLQQTNRKIKRVIAYILIALGIVFLIC